VSRSRSDQLPAGGFETVCAHHGEDRQANFGAAALPIFQTSTFVYPDAVAWDQRDKDDAERYFYTRRGNPTTAALESKLARLEGGEWARAFASGMGAITACLNLCTSAGAHVVVVSDCYGPTRTYLQKVAARFGVSATFVEGIDPQRYLDALRPQTRLIYLESPTTGRMDVIDIAPITATARQRGIVTLLDNSWSSPYFQKPLDLGVDLVLHSATKFISGHSDTLGGIVIGRDAQLRERLWFEAELQGAQIDPFAAWLLVRGLRTLALRMEQHQVSGLTLARTLAESPKVARVYYPGLASYANYAVARRQMRGFSGLLGFALGDQTEQALYRFINSLRLFAIGCSWGGHESLVVGGRSDELFGQSKSDLPYIIRLHAGLEATEDLVVDVQRALEAV
jgi:cystathionine beta-lyase